MTLVVFKMSIAAATALTTMVALSATPTPDIKSGAETIAAAASKAISFQYPLPTWDPHCLGFGSEWRYCDSTVLRRCGATGAIWLHTGVDIKTGIQPVMAAANGTIIGYIVDPQFRGGVLIRHETTNGIVITQYWHVWPRDRYRVGTAVRKGEVFGDIADMGSRTHFHFAVFTGDYEATAWRGALPPSRCEGFPAFPNRFVNGTDFVQAHLQPEPQTVLHHCRLGPQL